MVRSLDYRVGLLIVKKITDQSLLTRLGQMMDGRGV